MSAAATGTPAEPPAGPVWVVDLGPDPTGRVGGRAIVRGPHGERVLVVRTRRGVVAVAGECPHRSLPLDEARVTGRTLVCPSHRWRFDVRSGACRDRGRAARLTVYRAWRAGGHLFLAAPPPH
ncbi:MAG: Rieske 2Fe-2S domain-containing protein [Pseudonocardia sp.]|uniref:Rieske (2Fe-2S) protein n=1 Tax=unclassified Pseudonocardia TaxID=2619320 RepID=UPI00086CFC1E|nr:MULTISPECIES: Rieske 2Fe-2S domain-containing protein [unclassified Pseudonocardia]MBN9112208.1 Rieske 2Fe-2S domain-containing protein [Pseudonocardia sp.]ODU30144.1 MAG: hypothetical protein ABS80_00640 [Pseudonocardia sp. SCN 72-51]ODV03068.1 MAG: hypothetical protein ABT15_23865 [Pseudonocardia sp. SCN 73-27]